MNEIYVQVFSQRNISYKYVSFGKVKHFNAVVSYLMLKVEVASIH